MAFLMPNGGITLWDLFSIGMLDIFQGFQTIGGVCLL